MSMHAIAILALVFVLAVSATPAQAKSCAEAAREINDAFAASDHRRAEAIVKEAEGVCRGPDLDLVGRQAALTLIRSANNPGIATEERQRLIRTSIALGRPWQASASAGDLAMSEKRHVDAARLFQEALDDIRNERLNPSPPRTETIAALVRKAEAASLLSKTHVARVDRSGAPGGLACPTFRSFVVTRTAVPIEFEFKEPGFKKSGVDAFTEKGRAAAEDLASFLAKQAAPAVHLIGHTDPIGSDDYNLQLSRLRAEAVAAFLKARGFKGDVRTSGQGRSRPFAADDPGSYSESERHQMDRRVELERQGGAPCASPSG